MTFKNSFAITQGCLYTQRGTPTWAVLENNTLCKEYASVCLHRDRQVRSV